jgi:hypothetical protein
MGDIRVPCNCGDPECQGYRLDDLGKHPFFVPIDKSLYDKNARILGDENSEKAAFPFGIVKTSSWEFDGERTDLHDLFAVFWGVYLRVSGIANSALFSERGFAISSEIYARAVIPLDWGKNYRGLPDDELRLLLAKTSVHLPSFVHRIFLDGDDDDILDNRADFEQPPWLGFVLDHCVIGDDKQYELQTRDWPKWTCFTEIESGLTVAEISNQAAANLKNSFERFTPSTYYGVERWAIKTDELRNAVSFSVLETLKGLAQKVDGRIDETLLIIPMGSHVLAIGSRSLICIADDCGHSAYNDEQSKIESRREKEASFFLTDAKCIWNNKISDSRFEEMIGELVKAERGVARVRQVGSTREADDGRDFIAEWTAPKVTSLMNGVERSLFAPSDSVEEILVQVKIRSKGVGRSDAHGLRDSIEHHDCTGLLFVAYPNVTTTLNDHLHKLRKQGKWWIDWWNRIDIEDRLLRNTDIAERYNDVVVLVRPDDR